MAPSLRVRLDGAAFKADPHPTFAAMRAAGPVTRVRVPFLGNVWTTSTHAATLAAVKSGDLVLEGRNAGRGGGVAGLRWWMPRTLKRLAHNMLAKDDPDHRRLRKLVDRAFARRNVQAMRMDVEACADRLLDEMSAEAELVSAYARRLPLYVIADLLGITRKRRDAFAAMASRTLSVRSAFDILRAAGGLRSMNRFIEEEIEVARRDEREGLIGELVRTEANDGADGERLSHEELVAMIFLLLVAGFETTTHLIATSVIALEENPAQKAWWLEDETRTERTVEELARFNTPVQMTKPRFVARDLDLEGVRLSRGEIVMPCLAAANADPAAFDEPDQLMLDRFPNPHLVFSSGVHFCLGMQLARIEAQVALTRLYRRFPALRLASNDQDWMPRLGLRGVRSLPVLLT